MRISILAVIFTWVSLSVSGQRLHFAFNFDDCNFEGPTTGFPGISTGGNPACVCGIGESAIQLNGLNDYLEFDPQTNALFSNNFTLDFYFLLDDVSGIMDIMSLRSGCGKLDSMMQLRYFSSTNELNFEIGSHVNNYYSYKTKLDKSNCWHRFSLVKFGLEYQVYLDNKLMGKFVARENINLTRAVNLSFGNNPCNIFDNTQRFKGKIDEIRLYSAALSDIELLSIFEYPDRIITNNTTIFQGESVQLETGHTCASNISWTPVSTLSNASAPNPIATPDITTTYKVSFNNVTCISTDTVIIFTTNKDDLDCANLLLPKAFTPNNDGLNDTYGISNTFIIEHLDYFEIYNRSGEKVWETKVLEEQWNGSKNESLLNTGTYMYKIKYQCSEKEYVKFDSFVLLR